MTPATRARIEKAKNIMPILGIPWDETIGALISELEKYDRALEIAKVELRNISENGFGFVSGHCEASLKRIAQILEGGAE